MNTSILVRSAKVRSSGTHTTLPTILTRFASSSAGPSTDRSHPKRKTRVGQRGVAPKVLRELVDLHHTAASFLHSPDDISTGFENAFRHTYSDPYFIPYRQYRDNVLAGSAERGVGGITNLAERATPQSAGRELDKRERLRLAPTYWRTFKKHDELWSDRREEAGSEGGMFSERELAVREALFGTWERGGVGMKKPEPGLNGVKEYLAAKGVSVKDYAKEWEKRNQFDDE